MFRSKRTRFLWCGVGTGNLVGSGVGFGVGLGAGDGMDVGAGVDDGFGVGLNVGRGVRTGCEWRRSRRPIIVDGAHHLAWSTMLVGRRFTALRA